MYIVSSPPLFQDHASRVLYSSLYFPVETRAFDFQMVRKSSLFPSGCVLRCASQQPRIVCSESHRETTGWDGPGAYEWDEMAEKNDRERDHENDDFTSRGGAGGSGCNFDGDDDGRGGKGRISLRQRRLWSRDRTRTKGVRPKGIVVKEPKRQSPAFREGDTRFIHPNLPNVRGFAVLPSSSRGVGVAGDEESATEERRGHGDYRRAACTGGSFGQRRKPPQRLWMFQPTNLPYEPASTTAGWDGPGAYAVERSLASGGYRVAGMAGPRAASNKADGA